MSVVSRKKIARVRNGRLDTIMKTEGHTYKKVWEKALYEVNEPLPVWGNLGAGCVDREVLEQGKEAFREGRPRVVRIDTSDPSDILFGSGTFCGGRMEVLLEPLFEQQKAVCRRLMEGLEEEIRSGRRRSFHLVHELDGGALHLHSGKPAPAEGTFVEVVLPPASLFVFGATPLAYHVVKYVEAMDVRVHLADWRRSYLERFEGIAHVRTARELGRLDPGSVVLVMSHDYERDREVLGRALSAGCAHVGLLSSRTRRDRMLEELRGEGIPEVARARVSSPVGVEIRARTDPEVAVSIVAELVRWMRGDDRGDIPGGG